VTSSQQRPILPASKPSTSSSFESKKPNSSSNQSTNSTSSKQVCWNKLYNSILSSKIMMVNNLGFNA